MAENLKCAQAEYCEHALHHWAREKNGSDAEVDFLVQVGSAVVTVEVKAGATGTMKSLHQFMLGKDRSFGIRINGDKPSYLETTIVDASGEARPSRSPRLPEWIVFCAWALTYEPRIANTEPRKYAILSASHRAGANGAERRDKETCRQE